VGLFHLITKHFDAMEVPFSKLFTYASDGASVVASKLGGLAGLLTQRINGYLLAMHCVTPPPPSTRPSTHQQARVQKDRCAVRDASVLLLCQIAHKHALTLKEAVDFSEWAQRFDHIPHQRLLVRHKLSGLRDRL
jgi:hypothetical protein